MTPIPPNQPMAATTGSSNPVPPIKIVGAGFADDDKIRDLAARLVMLNAPEAARLAQYLHEKRAALAPSFRIVDE